MKKIIFTLITSVILFSSCEKWINPDINIDPNNPTDVSMAQLVAPIEVNLAYVVGGELTRYSSAWMQQIAGLQSQSAEVDLYILGESDVNDAWSYNLYAPGMINAKILIEKATANNSPHYAGIGKILMAYHLGVITDLWGDAPYSDALNGIELKFKPKYDSQEKIYTTIFTLLTDAVTDLQASKSVYSPGDEDVIYGGNLSKWIKAAYALKARYNLHLAKKKGASAYTEALANTAKAFTSNDDDFKLVFNSAYNNANPIYKSEQERPGYLCANSTYIAMLKAQSDPRLLVYFNGNIGSAAGENNANASKIGDAYGSSVSPVYLISYAEVKFIEAEAYLMTGNKEKAAESYNEALKASLQRESALGDGSWYNSQKETAATISLAKVMNQKYQSSFLQLECWTDWRRTGFPALVKPLGAVISEIPRRLPYPDDERLYNGDNMPAGLNLTSRIWWDVN